MLLMISLMAKAVPFPNGGAAMLTYPGKSTKLVIKLIATMIRPITMRRAKVFSQRLLTNLLLRPRLSNAPFCSMIIVGTTSENMISRIIPGITSRRIPMKIKTPVMIDATKREGSLDMVKLKLS